MAHTDTHTFSAHECRCSKETECKIACECRCLEQAQCLSLHAKFRCLGRNKSVPKREEPWRVYPSSKAVADLASEIRSLFPAEIPKHLPVSQLLTAWNPTRCHDCSGKAAHYWSGRRRTDKYLCKAYRAQRLEHIVSPMGGGKGKEDLAFSKIK